MPLWPGQTPRSVGVALGTAGVSFLLGGLVEINPIWLWRPFHTYSSTNDAQPDWYLGWLIGGLRLMPSFDIVIGGYTLVPNPFWGGAAFPLVFLAGGADRVFVLFGLDYAVQITVYRVIVFVLPVVFGVAAWRICKELTASERVLAGRRAAEVEARLARAATSVTSGEVAPEQR